MSDQNYFLPGEYVGDMHYGMVHIQSMIEERLGCPVECRHTWVEVFSEEQRLGMERFLDATRALSSEKHVGYLNKMLVAIDEKAAVYLYDGRYFGIVTWRAKA